MYIAEFEEILQFASSTAVPNEFVEAKAEFFRLTGEIGDDENTYEARMQAFLEWYIFDRKLVKAGLTPLQIFLSGRTMLPEDAARYNGFTNTVAGIFELKRIAKESLKLRDMWTGKDYIALERRHVIGLKKGDLLETRIIPYMEHLCLSRSVILHPPEIYSLLKKGIKKIKKEDKISREEYFQHISYARLKLDRFGQPDKLPIIYGKVAAGDYDSKP